MCAGGLIRDHLGRWVHGFTVNIGFTSSCLAELWGCREGLKLAHTLQLQHLILEMDSLMAIQLIQTRQVEKGPFSVLCFLMLSATVLSAIRFAKGILLLILWPHWVANLPGAPLFTKIHLSGSVCSGVGTLLGLCSLDLRL
ncbi:hypothetical protein SLE2022_111260 [Rubroshorea leprosula]